LHIKENVMETTMQCEKCRWRKEFKYAVIVNGTMLFLGFNAILSDTRATLAPGGLTAGSYHAGLMRKMPLSRTHGVYGTSLRAMIYHVMTGLSKPRTKRWY
jgi:hypothetical protein